MCPPTYVLNSHCLPLQSSDSTSWVHWALTGCRYYALTFGTTSAMPKISNMSVTIFIFSSQQCWTVWSFWYSWSANTYNTYHLLFATCLSFSMYDPWWVQGCSEDLDSLRCYKRCHRSSDYCQEDKLQSCQIRNQVRKEHSYIWPGNPILTDVYSAFLA